VGGDRSAALHTTTGAAAARAPKPAAFQPRRRASATPLRAFDKGAFLAGLVCLKPRGRSPARPERKPVLCVTIPKFWNPRSYQKMAATSLVRRTSNTDV